MDILVVEGFAHFCLTPQFVNTFGSTKWNIFNHGSHKSSMSNVYTSKWNLMTGIFTYIYHPPGNCLYKMYGLEARTNDHFLGAYTVLYYKMVGPTPFGLFQGGSFTIINSTFTIFPSTSKHLMRRCLKPSTSPEAARVFRGSKLTAILTIDMTGGILDV